MVASHWELPVKHFIADLRMVEAIYPISGYRRKLMCETTLMQMDCQERNRRLTQASMAEAKTGLASYFTLYNIRTMAPKL